MTRKYLVLLYGVFALTSMAVVGGSFFDGGWRISVGAAYNAPSKMKLSFSPAKFYGGSVVPTVISGRSSDEAKAIAQGKTTGTRTDYNGPYGKSFVDTSDSRTAIGGLEQGTWNVQVPYDSWNGEAFVVASADYRQSRVVHDGHGGLELSGQDSSAQPGVMVELSRNLYHNEEYHFGVDLAFAVSYWFENNIFKSGSSYASDATEVTEGKWETTVAPDSGVREESWKTTDGNYGSGSFWGPGPVFNSPVLKNSKISTTTYRDTASFDARGDYSDLEMMLTLRPYYDAFDWLRLYGTFGVAVSRAQFDLDVWGLANGNDASYSRSKSAWDVYGVGGLGLMLRWDDFCLGADFLARFWDDDVKIDEDWVHGNLRRGHWMFRAYLGYEF